MHIKRQTIDKKWPIPRKGSKYVVAPSHNKKLGIPVLIILRDIIKIVKTRKEAKHVINNKEISLNNKVVKMDNLTVTLFDILSIKSLNKNYRLTVSEQGKFKLEEVDGKEKICKVINKKIVKKGFIQLNLHDGMNILTKDKINTGDSVILNLQKKEITRYLPLKKGARVLIISGKNIGKSGEVKDVKGKISYVEVGEKKLSMENKNLIVV